MIPVPTFNAPKMLDRHPPTVHTAAEGHAGQRTTGLDYDRPFPFVVRATFLALTVSIPFDGVDVMPGIASLAKFTGYAFIASLVICPKRFTSRSPGALPMKCFVAYLIIYVFGGFAIPEEAMRPFAVHFFRLLQYLVLFFLACEMLKDVQLTRTVLLLFCLACTVIAVGSLLNVPGFAVESATEMKRQTALDYNQNAVALLMALCIVISTGLWIYGNFQLLWQKCVLIGLPLPCLVLLLRTGSRAGVGAFVLGFMVFLLPGSGFRKQAGMVLAVIIAVLAANDIRGSSAFERWSKTYYEGHLAGRERMYPAAEEMFLERPMTGWIVYQHELADRTGGRFLGGARNAHNDLFHLLLQVGLIGTIPFVIGVSVVSWRAWKARLSPFGVLPLALMVTMFSNGLGHTGVDDKHTWLFMGLAVAAFAVFEQSGHETLRGRRLAARTGSGLSTRRSMTRTEIA
jgi:O-antigen ligase